MSGRGSRGLDAPFEAPRPPPVRRGPAPGEPPGWGVPERATPQPGESGRDGLGQVRARRTPSQGAITRRRLAVRSSKLLLPLGALVLLASVALWPELNRMLQAGRNTLHALLAVEGTAGRMLDPRYRGVDARGRPYMVTADTALQDGPERVNLKAPKADVTLQNGTWLMVRSRDGVYMQHAGQLDLSHDVWLYRGDGTTMTSETADIDLKQGAAASNTQTHAEGPFGTLDAPGFALVDKGAVVQFPGPARMVLNGGGR